MIKQTSHNWRLSLSIVVGSVCLGVIGATLYFQSRLMNQDKFIRDCASGRPISQCLSYYPTFRVSRLGGVTYYRVPERYPELSTVIYVVREGLIVALFRLDSDSVPQDSSYSIPTIWEDGSK